MSEIYFYDCNCTFGKLSKVHEYTPTDKETVIRLLKKINVKRAIVSHTSQQYLTPKEGNEILVSEIKNDEIFVPSVTVMTNSSGEFISLKELDRFIDKNGVKLAQMFPKTHNFSPAEWQMGETYSYLEEKGIPLMLSINEVSADQIYEILSNHKKLNIICKDTSFSHDRNIMRLMELFENLYLESGTYSTCGGISYVTEKFGADRLIFGSGLQFAEPGAACAKVLCADISDEDKIKIAHKNIEKLIKEGE